MIDQLRKQYGQLQNGKQKQNNVVLNRYSFPQTAGGLISYGPNFDDQVRNTAAYVDRILKGESPGGLPVQTPTKFELVINLKTAKAIGTTVPRPLLERADEIIE